MFDFVKTFEVEPSGRVGSRGICDAAIFVDRSRKAAAKTPVKFRPLWIDDGKIKTFDMLDPENNWTTGENLTGRVFNLEIKNDFNCDQINMVEIDYYYPECEYFNFSLILTI